MADPHQENVGALWQRLLDTGATERREDAGAIPKRGQDVSRNPA